MSETPENPFADDSHGVDDGASEHSAAVAGYKRYTLYYTTSRMDVRLHLSSPQQPTSSSSSGDRGPAVYYFESKWTASHPQYQLRRGGDKKSPMVGFMMRKSHTENVHLMLGHGDWTQQDITEIAWEELEPEVQPMWGKNYHFNAVAAAAQGAGGEGGEKVPFSWRKTVGKGTAEELKKKKRTSVLECVRDADGHVVARLRSGGALNWRKGGEIDMQEGLDQALEESLLTSALSVWVLEMAGGRSIFKGYEDK